MQWGTNDKGRMHSKLNKQYRHEYKYYLDACQSAVLESRCSLLLPRDSHAGSCGSYQIKSLYFDDWDNSCYYENEDGVDERSKFRIRYYNQNLEYISLEKKSKKRVDILFLHDRLLLRGDFERSRSLPSVGFRESLLTGKVFS